MNENKKLEIALTFNSVNVEPLVSSQKTDCGEEDLLAKDLADMFKPKIRRIKWLNEDLILIGGTHGPIATEEQYVKGRCSLGYLCPDGNISVFGKHAGTKDDIEFGEFIELEPDPKAIVNMSEGFFDNPFGIAEDI